MLTKLGKYEIRRELGRGAMGIVYEGFDPYIERPVAIKTIQKTLIDQSEASEIFSRFRREAQAAGRLTHPNIVAIYEYGEEGDMAFIAMELLDGVELKEYFDKAKRFQLNEGVSIMLQLLEALEYSHERGVVHRDIKPSNILIAKNGKIKIADFGIAKIESSDLTHVGTILGTPSYMSPEQFLGLVADRRSDLYSAGVILYQLLTGERPFTGSNMSIIMHKVLHQAPVPPGQLNPVISQAMDEVVKKALSKRPEDRFQTAGQFMEALKLASEATIKPEPQSPSKNPGQKPPQGGAKNNIMMDFNLEEFNKRQDEEERQQARRMARETTRLEEPEDDEPTVKIPAPSPAASQKELPPAAPPETGLLARLAREAQEKLDSKQSAEDEKQARNRRVHETLDRIYKFFTPFIKHVNSMEPAIGRTYRLDARTVFANLKWRGATIDSRKQSLADMAPLAFVVFGVNLCTTEAVMIKRPRDQFEALKRELQHLGLRPLDDLDELYKKQKQEWLEARLEPSFPVQITFKGNYETGKIEVATRNMEYFGAAAFKLAPEDITPALLDELGLFLMGGANKPPGLLR